MKETIDSVTGIILLVGGLKREKDYTVIVWEERTKNTFNFDTFQRMYQKKFMNRISILF